MSEPASDTSPPTIAPHPFNQPSADLTLRTPDRVDFHVHSPILAQASPVFADMFSLPQPSGISRDTNIDRPVVEVTEDSKTLERLLRLCYPIEKDKLDELEDIVPVLQAAMKYDMKWPISLLTTDLRTIAPRSPLKVWAVASRCGLESLAQEAAASMLRRAKGQPDSPPPQPSSSVSPLTLLRTMLEEHGEQTLHGISAADYFRLREYLRVGTETVTTNLLSPGATLPPLSSPACEPRPLTPMIPQSPPPDLTLRCPGGTEYRVHSLFFTLYSTFGERVRDIISAASSSPEAPETTGTGNHSHSLPLDVDIDPPTLSILLATMYGGNKLPSDLRSLSSTIIAANRFGIVHVAEAAKERWNGLAADSPLEAYFIALERGLTDYARAAARKVLETSVAGTYVGAMESGTALTYHHLLEYYRACARKIDTRMDAAAKPWSRDLNNMQHGYYNNSGYYSSSGHHLQNPTYITNTYLTGLAATMDIDVPSTGCSFDSDLTLPTLLRKSSQIWPSSVATICNRYVEVLVKISAELPQIIADAIAEVELEIQ